MIIYVLTKILFAEIYKIGHVSLENRTLRPGVIYKVVPPFSYNLVYNLNHHSL